MAWHQPGDKPLPEPMMVSLLTHICVTRPQWVNGWMLFTYPYSPGLLLWHWYNRAISHHYSEVIVSAMASQIPSISIDCLTAFSGGDHRKHQSSASLAFVRGIHRWSVDSPHKGPVTRKNVSMWWRRRDAFSQLHARDRREHNKWPHEEQQKIGCTVN